MSLISRPLVCILMTKYSLHGRWGQIKGLRKASLISQLGSAQIAQIILLGAQLCRRRVLLSDPARQHSGSHPTRFRSLIILLGAGLSAQGGPRLYMPLGEAFRLF